MDIAALKDMGSWFALIVAAAWFAKYIILPFRDNHFETVKKLTDTSSAQTALMQRMDERTVSIDEKTMDIHQAIVRPNIQRNGQP